MRLALILVVALALVPQVAFSGLYWIKIPQWTKNPYGRLAQLGSWCHILLLSLYLLFLAVGRYMNRYVAEGLLIVAFGQLFFFGILQLHLLMKAYAESSKSVEEESNEEGEDDS